MKNNIKFLTAASLLAASLACPASAMEPPAGTEKCYGIAKAGANDCASADGAHSCAGAAPADNLPTEWVAVPAGKCAEMGGTTEAPAAEAAEG